jgi:hypothetical protein
VIVLRSFLLEDVLNVGIELIAYLFQWNFIFSVVFESQTLLWLGLKFILLLISLRFHSFFSHPLCSFAFHIILAALQFGWESKIFAIRVGMP